MSKRIHPLLALATLLALLTTGCAGGADQPRPGASSATGTLPASKPAPSSAPASSATRKPSPSRAPRPATRATPVVVLDPGHNGGNATHPDQIHRQVPAGRGHEKPCNTTGTATDSGYPEHAFTFAVAGDVATALRARGVRVLLTRPNDTGVGPCVDQRAAIGNRADAAAVVSIHADGAPSSSEHGFHVSYSSPPLNPAQGAPSRRLATGVRDAMRRAGLATSDYLGSDGIYPRDDLAGLNLSTRPAVLVECGNMRNPSEAAAFTDPRGRARYAQAIAAGILGYLGKGK